MIFFLILVFFFGWFLELDMVFDGKKMLFIVWWYMDFYFIFLFVFCKDGCF